MYKRQGIGKAASQHILIKDAVALEQMRKVDVVVLPCLKAFEHGRYIMPFNSSEQLGFIYHVKIF